MTEVEPALDFASSGRSGRRNALPDILGSPAGVSPSDLPLKLAELSLTGHQNSPVPSCLPVFAPHRQGLWFVGVELPNTICSSTSVPGYTHTHTLY
uniref:Uncharacterized protein n=1 Tax=Cyprinus carpio carpio TaxID=630221 RepID=A0A9J8AZX4_CYPCA